MKTIAITIVTVMLFSCNLFSQSPTNLVGKTASPDYDTNDLGNLILVRNKMNKMYKQKIPANNEGITTTGFDLKKFQTNFLNKLRALSIIQKNELNSYNIPVTFYVKPDGKVEEVDFYTQKNMKVSFSTVSILEKAFKSLTFPIKNADRNKTFAYVPITVILRGSEIQ